MIPKVIHYCWFGKKPLPTLAKKCIASWEKFLPDYEIKEWNEENFDVNIIPYTKEAYEAKKYAFVSDFARFWILYKYGGLYFDTDVEIIKPIYHIINNGPFMGCEKATDGNFKFPSVAPGLGLGVNPGLGLYKEILDYYETLHFKNTDGTLNLKTVVEYTTKILMKNGFKNNNSIQKVKGITIYPPDYFNPKSYYTGKITITHNTVSIHHFSDSWKSPSKKFKIKIQKIIGPSITKALVSLKKRIKKNNITII